MVYCMILARQARHADTVQTIATLVAASPPLALFFNQSLFPNLFTITALDVDGSYTLPAGVIAVPLFTQTSFLAYSQLVATGYAASKQPPFYPLYQPRPNLHALAPFDGAARPAVIAWIRGLLALQQQNPLLLLAFGLHSRSVRSKVVNAPVMGLPENVDVIDVNILAATGAPDAVHDVSAWVVAQTYNAVFTQAFQGLLQAAPQSKLYAWNLLPQGR